MAKSLTKPKKRHESRPARTQPRDQSVHRVVGFPIVGVGASAGGLEAFTQLLQNLPGDTGMAFVLVQHLDPVHASALAQILSKTTSLSVQEVTNNLRVEPDHIYVIPPNKIMHISQGVLKLEPREESRGGYRTIDTFFASLAEDQHERAIGVILSGTASDGTIGLEAIKAAGGITFAQDESAKYDSMPRSAIAAGCVDLVLSPAKIAEELAQIVRHPYIALKPSGHEESTEEGITPDLPRSNGRRSQTPSKSNAQRGGALNSAFRKILAMLRNHRTVDFSLYKTRTIRRRTDRRMALNKFTSLDAYAQFLRKTPREIDALHSDLLIGVTSFFRNPEAFDTLKEAVFPKLVHEYDDPVRIWVPGCSTGQEAYSIAMAFAEFSDSVGRSRDIQIFATDVNEKILTQARSGFYVNALVQDVSPERLRRFFVEDDGGYRVSKTIREKVIFARQNILKDPPFSRMHLISCRNLLIYLEANAQSSLFPKLHHALRPEGFLFLGASESVASHTDLFEQVDKKSKIFRKKSRVLPTLRLDFVPHQASGQSTTPASTAPQRPEKSSTEINVEHEADRVALSLHSPPGMLVNAELQVLQFRGDTGPYLKSRTGRASLDALKIVATDLVLPLRKAFELAKKDRKAVRSESVGVYPFARKTGRRLRVNIEIVPLKNLKERCYLIFFAEADPETRPSKSSSSRTSTEQRSGSGKSFSSKSSNRELAVLRHELSETHEYLRSVQEQSQAAQEEIQASNEELTSANEELQSINEELETSQEELESTNEELITVNEEMTNRNTELDLLNGDLLNFQSSAEVPIILLTRDFVVRRFTAGATKPFNLLAADVGRPITQIRHNLDISDLEEFVGDVINNAQTRDREVRDKNGHWYSLRVRPYLSVDKKVDGAVLVLLDIDALKRAGQIVGKAREHAEAIIRSIPDPLLLLDDDLQVCSGNEALYNTFKITETDIIGRSIFDICDGAWRNPELRKVLVDIVSRNSFFNDFEIAGDFGESERRTLLINGRVLNEYGDQPRRVLVGMRDVTASKKAEHHRNLLMAELDHRVKNTLATVQSIARHSIRASASLDQFSEAFDARLMALSETHNLLTLGEWRSAPLRDVIMIELSPYDTGEDRRVTVVGEEVELNSRQALAFGLTIHELATNAAKYGALSVPGGNVGVSWDIATLNDGRVLQLRWIESGGPVVEKPSARGFGSELIEQSMASEADAHVQLDFQPAGVRFTLKLTLSPEGQ